jgi:hypothetical protein
LKDNAPPNKGEFFFIPPDITPRYFYETNAIDTPDTFEWENIPNSMPEIQNSDSGTNMEGG